MVQTFSDRINFHPHIHVLITEGGTTADGAFHCVIRFLDEFIQDIFTPEEEAYLELVGMEDWPKK